MNPYEQFQSITLKVGTVVDAQPFEGARKPAIKVWVDFGDYGIKKTSAQITKRYTADLLIGKQVVALVDIPPRQIGTFMSECLLLGAVDVTGDVILLQPDQTVANGLNIQ